MNSKNQFNANCFESITFVVQYTYFGHITLLAALKPITFEDKMFYIREPKYQWGQPVVALTDLINDGCYPGAVLDSLLIERGTQGEIVQSRLQEESNTPVYLVKFPGGKVIGCMEPEIAPARHLPVQVF